MSYIDRLAHTVAAPFPGLPRPLPNGKGVRNGRDDAYFGDLLCKCSVSLASKEVTEISALIGQS
jgi:hypothetical protein